MAPIKLYGSLVSTATMRVLVTLYEKEVEFEFVPIDMRAGEHKKDSFLAINPFGQVPAFEDGDLKLFESRAITKFVAHQYADKGTQLKYIAHQHADKGTQLKCGDMKTTAMTLVWIEAEAHQFDPPASKLAWELAIKPLFGMVTDNAVVEENESKLGKVLDVYESRLSHSKYLACDCVTLADLHHVPNIQYLLGTKAKKLFDSRPHVCKWVADITARPSWLKVLEMQKKQ